LTIRIAISRTVGLNKAIPSESVVKAVEISRNMTVEDL